MSIYLVKPVREAFLVAAFAMNAHAQTTTATQAEIDAKRDAETHSTDPHKTADQGGKTMNQKSKIKSKEIKGAPKKSAPPLDAGMEAKGTSINHPIPTH